MPCTVGASSRFLTDDASPERMPLALPRHPLCIFFSSGPLCRFSLGSINFDATDNTLSSSSRMCQRSEVQIRLKPKDEQRACSPRMSQTESIFWPPLCTGGVQWQAVIFRNQHQGQTTQSTIQTPALPTAIRPCVYLCVCALQAAVPSSDTLHNVEIRISSVGVPLFCSRARAVTAPQSLQ